MATSRRIRIPKPARIAPIRGGTLGIVGPPDATARSREPDPRPPTPSEAVLRTVERAYRVVDEHVRQGEVAARRIAKRSYGATAFAQDAQDVAARTAQFLSEVLEVWLQAGSGLGPRSPRARDPESTEEPQSAGQSLGSLVSTLLRASPSPSVYPLGETPPTSDGAPRSSPDDRARDALRLGIAVDSLRPVTVDVQLSERRRPVRVQPLQGPDGALLEVSIDEGTPACLSVRVPASVPTGVYSGLVVRCEDNHPVGSVMLEVREASGST